ncbi:MAG TPA: alkaline phosphatase family protein [archaeon]|nr:alkaline phosphatase family protein [archaeon]
MLQREIEEIIEKEKREGEFIKPFYEKYCLSNIPSTIKSFFNIKTDKPVLPRSLHRDKIEVEKCNKVVLFFVDGFGYFQWTRHYKDNEFLNTFTEKGLVSPITTVFPSTTAAAVTTINTGLTTQEHGLPEWTVYFKEIDQSINTLPFITLLGEDVAELGGNPKMLFDGQTFHQDLKKNNVKSFAFMNEQYARGYYSDMIFKGSTVVPYTDFSDLFLKLRSLLRKEKGQAYFYVYIGDIDAVGHSFGPSSEEYAIQVSMLAHTFKKELRKTDEQAAKETLILVTSDHGQVDISPNKTIYLNRFQKVNDALRLGKSRNPILPTGSPRDVFLHIKDGMTADMKEFLEHKLRRKIFVMDTNNAIKNGLFGIGKVNKNFHDRIGDLLLIPRKNNTVWYEHMPGMKLNMLGHHGGMNKLEMFIPFAIARLSDLI